MFVPRMQIAEVGASYIKVVHGGAGIEIRAKCSSKLAAATFPRRTVEISLNVTLPPSSSL